MWHMLKYEAKEQGQITYKWPLQRSTPRVTSNNPSGKYI